MKITAVIPVRDGSERVKKKCTRKFGNTNLLRLKIQTIQKVNEIDEIIVNTDSIEAIEIAKRMGVKYHQREPYYASSDCPANEFFYYLGKTTDTDIIAYTPVTSPFITANTISQLIQGYKFSGNNSIVTAGEIKEFLWMKNKPLNFNLDSHPKSQDLKGVCAINFGLCLIPKEILLESKSIIGPNPEVIPVSHLESIDIDSPLDFFLAEQYYIHTVINSKTLLD